MLREIGGEREGGVRWNLTGGGGTRGKGMTEPKMGER